MVVVVVSLAPRTMQRRRDNKTTSRVFRVFEQDVVTTPAAGNGPHPAFDFFAVCLAVSGYKVRQAGE